MTILMTLMIMVVGAAIGSFLNVCIWRLPREESIVRPPSHCPSCDQPIRFYDNIPIVSFLLLRGRCRSCGVSISWRYPLVEGLTAIMALLLFWKFGLSFQYLASFVFVAVLVVITFVDLDHQIIPDIITLPGIPLFLLAAVFIMNISFRDALIGMAIGGGLLYLIAFSYEFLTKREGMGGGDIKLLAMLGGFLGWQSLWVILLVSSLSGALVGLALMIARGADLKYAVPFGPFLAIGAMTYIFFGQTITRFMIFL
ncbi:MAG: prepilin peptidase [Syntrophales bacterium]|jgi:leader peptidase (prepilin peptidase)/N-methyltransferase